MFTPLLFMLLPLAFLIHDAEEIGMLTLEFSTFSNLLLAMAGVFIVAFNLWLMHRIFK